MSIRKTFTRIHMASPTYHQSLQGLGHTGLYATENELYVIIEKTGFSLRRHRYAYVDLGLHQFI